MQEKFFDIHPEVNKYSQLAYSEPSFLFYGDPVIKSCKGTQQGDPESSALLSNSTFCYFLLTLLVVLGWTFWFNEKVKEY